MHYTDHSEINSENDSSFSLSFRLGESSGRLTSGKFVANAMIVMHPIATGKELLDAIHKRPALYWGGGDHPFTSLVAFVSGYRIGHSETQRNNRIHPSDLVPDDFHKFVTERFGHRFPDGGKGWMTFIRDHTSSENEAFDLFFQLREEYDKAKEKQVHKET